MVFQPATEDASIVKSCPIEPPIDRLPLMPNGCYKRRKGSAAETGPLYQGRVNRSQGVAERSFPIVKNGDRPRPDLERCQQVDNGTLRVERAIRAHRSLVVFQAAADASIATS